MSITRYLVDTNVLLRFLSGQPVAQAAAARSLFARASIGEVVLEAPSVIVAEAFYTLHSFYGVERKTAASKLALLLRQHGVKVRELVLRLKQDLLVHRRVCPQGRAL